MNYGKSRLIEDGVPANNAGGGEIAGIGVGQDGEPGIKKKKLVPRVKNIIFRRT